MSGTTGKFRKISKKNYVMAGIISFLIFALGLTLGLVLEDQRYDWAQELSQRQEVNYQSLQMQYLFVDEFGDAGNCPVLLSTLQAAVEDLSYSLSRVVDYEKDSSITEEDYKLVARVYTLDNLRYWLLAEKAKESCDLDIVSVLYFYSDDCPSCPNQGTVLTYFKKLLGEEFLVFPIDLNLRDEEPMVDIMLSLFEVEKNPTLIIGDGKYEGVVKKTQMEEVICTDRGEAYPCLS